jgi:hypothetical protein
MIGTVIPHVYAANKSLDLGFVSHSMSVAAILESRSNGRQLVDRTDLITLTISQAVLTTPSAAVLFWRATSQVITAKSLKPQ